MVTLNVAGGGRVPSKDHSGIPNPPVPRATSLGHGGWGTNLVEADMYMCVSVCAFHVTSVLNLHQILGICVHGHLLGVKPACASWAPDQENSCAAQTFCASHQAAPKAKV